MRIALIADAYPPLRSSGAVQLRDLAREFVLQGHQLVVIVPSGKRGAPSAVESIDGVNVLRVATAGTKDIGHFRRAMAEMLLPLAMWHAIRKSPLRSAHWDGIVWYAPSIFLGLLVGVLKRSARCPTYLILRDIFPEWALNMGLMRKGLAYRFFKLVERYQYRVADTIGVQSKSNLPYFDDLKERPGKRLEVLQNWLAPAMDVGSSICLAKTAFHGRTILLYAGNMGVAQGMDAFLDLAERLAHRPDVGFMFVGRGSEASRMRKSAVERALNNVVFHDEIDPQEIPGLLAQCHIGLVALAPDHKTHNVPGKFLTYMQAGLPVLARINPGNDLAELIVQEGVGSVYVGSSLDHLQSLTEGLVDNRAGRELMSVKCRALAKRLFSPEATVKQIVAALNSQMRA